jgi:hypothetical protein
VSCKQSSGVQENLLRKLSIRNSFNLQCL